MANFHTNNLWIAANEADMKKVLSQMALNLRYNHRTTGFTDSVDGTESAQELYYLVGPYIDAYYMEVFCGAPIGTEGWKTVGTTGLPGGVSVQVAVAPSGRGMSDTASVGFTRYGSIYLLSVDYSTAWRPNTEDLNSFFNGLPAGDYGIAFYDADEYDGYDTISVFSGLHHGGADLYTADAPLTGTVASDELRQQKVKEREIRLSEITNLAKMARVAANRGWSEFGWADEDYDEDEYEEDEYPGDGESVDFRRPPSLNWDEPGPVDWKRIDNAVLGTLEKFPFFSEVTGAAYEGRVDNIERIIAGDELELVSDWNSPYFSPAGVEVFGPGRLSLGNLDSIWSSGLRLSDEERAAIACMLPYVRAYADTIIPLSIRDGRSRHPEVVVRLEMAAGCLDEILDAVHTLLGKPRAERSLTSITKEVW